jgi:serpin B
LPEAVDGLAEVENAVTPGALKSLFSQLDQADPHKNNVRLPRFTFHQRVDLIPCLRSLGIASAFDSTTADFSGIDPANNLFISQALHQTFVEVNESGTEAAAVTLFEAKSKGMTGLFNADHPFLFLIRDLGSGEILFMGRMAAPES